jgi:hypothetical protein
MLEEQLLRLKKKLIIAETENIPNREAYLYRIRANLIGLYQENYDISNEKFMIYLNKSIEKLEEYLKDYNEKDSLKEVIHYISKTLHFLNQREIIEI